MEIHETEVSLMKEIWNWIQLAIAAVGGFLGWFLGGYDGFLYALVAFVIIDYLTSVTGVQTCALPIYRCLLCNCKQKTV